MVVVDDVVDGVGGFVVVVGVGGGAGGAHAASAPIAPAPRPHCSTLRRGICFMRVRAPGCRGSEPRRRRDRCHFGKVDVATWLSAARVAVDTSYTEHRASAAATMSGALVISSSRPQRDMSARTSAFAAANQRVPPGQPATLGG